MEVRVLSRDIAAVGAAVRRLGDDRTIVNEMAKEIRRAGKPVKKAVRSNALSSLPSRGGLNRWAAKAGVRVAVKRGPKSAGVSFAIGRNSQKRRSDINRLDAGRLRAPAWGNRRRWHLQSVNPGFATDAVTEEGVREFREDVIVAVDRAMTKVGL